MSGVTEKATKQKKRLPKRDRTVKSTLTDAEKQDLIIKKGNRKLGSAVPKTINKSSVDFVYALGQCNYEPGFRSREGKN